jgi:RNA polymerase sigma factor for flagellar operon FliA
MDAAERTQLIIEYLPNVRFIARRIYKLMPEHVPFEDLKSAGVVGLMDAVDKFHLSGQLQFDSFAKLRIRDAILDSLRSPAWGVQGLWQKGRPVERLIRALTAKLGRSPSEFEVSQALQMSLAEYRELRIKLDGITVSTLHFENRRGSGEKELGFLENRPEDNPLFRILVAETRDNLIDAIIALPARERFVLTLYYYEDLTMKEIAILLGERESRVSQIHAFGVYRLRARLADCANG